MKTEIISLRKAPTEYAGGCRIVNAKISFKDLEATGEKLGSILIRAFIPQNTPQYRSDLSYVQDIISNTGAYIETNLQRNIDLNEQSEGIF